MIKSKLVKAFMLGLCLSAFSTGVAFAQMETRTEDTSSAVVGEVIPEELEVLYAKQAEIDRYLFTDHAKEIEEKGIFINYTGVNVDVIEIGISPFTDENANYLYDIFGKDGIKVVEFDESVIYMTSGPVDDTVTSEVLPDKAELYETVVDPNTSVDDGSAPDAIGEDKVYKGGEEEVQIQIESTDEVLEDSDDVIFYTTTDAGTEGTDIQVVSAAEVSDAVKRGGDEDTNPVSTPMIVLIIAAGAAVIGGAVVVSNKKKVTK